MRKTIKMVLLCIGVIGLASCSHSATAYSKLLKQEKALMREYIKRHGYVITHTLPTDEEFMQNEKLFYAVQGYDRLYYRLDHRGDSIGVDSVRMDTVVIPPIRRGDKVSIRYRQFTLTQHPDTMEYWTTKNAAYPDEFRYMTDSKACQAWHVAVQLMRYPRSECTILVPSKFAGEAADNSVTPYGFQLKIVNVK